VVVPLGYVTAFGFPIVFWTGILTGIFIFAAGIVMILTFHTKYKFPVDVHHKLAFIGLALAIIHIILGLTIYVLPISA
jgi:cytochrome b subunit of formate dehydrogenase